MLEKILNSGAEKLTKDQQKTIAGGLKQCYADHVYVCTANECCVGNYCYPNDMFPCV